MSLHTMQVRMTAVEARLSDVEGGYGRTIYDLRRDVTALTIGVERILDHMGLPRATDVEVDERLDAS